MGARARKRGVARGRTGLRSFFGLEPVVWGSDGEGRYGVLVTRTPGMELPFGLLVVTRQGDNLGANLNADDLRRVRERIDEVLAGEERPQPPETLTFQEL